MDNIPVKSKGQKVSTFTASHISKPLNPELQTNPRQGSQQAAIRRKKITSN